MTEDTFAGIMALISETYALEFSEQRERVWWELLRDLEDVPARAAVVTLCKTSPFPPKPADLFRIVRGDPKDAEVLLAEEADLACRHLEANLVDYRVCDLGPILNAVVRAMNGPDAVVAQMIRDDWKFTRPQVTRLYSAFRRRGAPADLSQPALPIAVVERGALETPVVVARFEPTTELPALPERAST